MWKIVTLKCVLFFLCIIWLNVYGGGLEMDNYKKVSLENASRVELHDKLGLTGAEISYNILPAGQGVPFVHSHKQNEEIYFIVNGSGKVVIDGKEVNLTSGDFIKILPVAERQFFASDNSDITYICIQVKENSLDEFTQDDAIIK